MFKRIEYKLMLASVLLTVAAVVATWLFIEHLWLPALAAVCVAMVAFRMLSRNYKKFNKSVIFLLNALENGDFSFNFYETELSKERKEVNTVLNAIKNILARAREEEIENEKFLSLIVAAVPVGIAIVDERDFVKVANDAALRLLGLHVFTHLQQLGMVDEAVLKAFRSLASGRTVNIRVADEREERLISLNMSEIRFKKGSLRVITMSNIGSAIEASEMESWIKLIRVMTHEIMNSVAPITSLSETMLSAYGEDAAEGGEKGLSPREDKLRRNTVEAFETITSTARGLSSFVASYRRFTGIPKPELTNMRLAPFIERIVNLEMPVFRERGIEVDVSVAERDIAVNADEGQISQVLVNLLKNAAEAIPAEQKNGRIGIRVLRLLRDENKIQIVVSNNGTPIAEDVLPHIFIPFFTTKDTGTGIGLSVSRYIMRLHGGNLKHHAEDGRTEFCMVFPAPEASDETD